MTTDELRLRVAHILHRLLSIQNRQSLKKEVDQFEISSLHDDIYRLLEKPDL